MAMFPPAIPRVFIDWLTVPGEVVYDPFSGRGTTVLEACNSGRFGLGSDANPLAWVLSSAKAAPPAPHAISRRVAELRGAITPGDPTQEPPAIRAIFHPDVLGQLLWLRDALSVKSSVDRYLYSILLGILHANARLDGSPRGLTIAMPNTFAMAPGYVMRFKAARNLKPPQVDVLTMLAARIGALGPRDKERACGHAWLQDATEQITIPKRFEKPALIFTSPPYLGVMKYAKLNWIRLWLLKRAPAAVDSCLFSSGSLSRYLEFMSSVIRQLSNILSEEGRICMVIGDVRKGTSDINLASAVARHCVSASGLRVDGIIKDALPVRHKVSRIWRERRGQATKVDRIVVLSRPGTRGLPPIPSVDWSWPRTSTGSD